MSTLSAFITCIFSVTIFSYVFSAKTFKTKLMFFSDLIFFCSMLIGCCSYTVTIYMCCEHSCGRISFVIIIILKSSVSMSVIFINWNWITSSIIHRRNKFPTLYFNLKRTDFLLYYIYIKIRTKQFAPGKNRPFVFSVEKIRNFTNFKSL